MNTSVLTENIILQQKAADFMAENTKLKEEIEKLKALCDDVANENENLHQFLNCLRHNTYVSAADKVSPGQMSIFGETDFLSDETNEKLKGKGSS